MIGQLVLFGASGDLAGRYVLPALAALHAAGRLPPDFVVVGAARADWDDDGFRRHVGEQLREHAPEMTRASREALLAALRYRSVDLTDASSVAGVIGAVETGAPVAVYFAVPPSTFAPTITSLGRIGLPPGSRIAVEKPFGEDRASAVALNALLAHTFGAAGEQVVFRVDHALGMATLHNLLGLRLTNRPLTETWNSAHIEQIDILWEETIALEGRAGYFDRAGTLIDVVQNHMLQVLAIVAMEPPLRAGEQDLRDRKTDVLRRVRVPPDAATKGGMRRARYGPGRLAGTGGAADVAVPADADEAGVDPARGTETFAEITLEIDSPQWSGTRFVLRAGKALARRRKGVVVRFRLVEDGLFDTDQPIPRTELWIGIDGPDDLSLRLTGSSASLPPEPMPIVLEAPPPPSDLPAYARVLLDILEGDDALAVSGDEAEESWRIVEPVLAAWRTGDVPLEEYPAGSSGPLQPAGSGAARLPGDT